MPPVDVDPEPTHRWGFRRWLAIVLGVVMLVAAAYLVILGIFAQFCFGSCPESSVGEIVLIAGLVLIAVVPFALAVVSGQQWWFARGMAGLAFLMLLLLSVEVAPLPPVAVGLATAVALRSPGPGATPARLVAVGLVTAIPLIVQLVTGLDASDGGFYAAAFGALPAVGLADAVTAHRLRRRTRAR